MLKKFVGWLRGQVRQEVQEEIKDNLAELRGQIQQAFYQGTQEALAAVRAEFGRPARRASLTHDELDATFLLPVDGDTSNGHLPELELTAAATNGKARKSKKN